MKCNLLSARKSWWPKWDFSWQRKDQWGLEGRAEHYLKNYQIQILQLSRSVTSVFQFTFIFLYMQISDGCLWPAVYEGHLIILSNIYINVYVEQSEHKICYWPHCPLGKWNPVWYFTRLGKPNQQTSTSTGFIFDRWWVSKSPFWHIYKYVLLAYSIWY